MNSSPTAITSRPQELQKLFEKAKAGTTSSLMKEVLSARNGVLNEIQTRRILKEPQKGRDRAKFGKLWAGDYSGFPSQSEADIALCRILALHCGLRKSWVDELFRKSPLYQRNGINL